MGTKKLRPKQYEKNISLHPLKFKDAVAALLQVKPEPKKTLESERPKQ